MKWSLKNAFFILFLSMAFFIAVGFGVIVLSGDTQSFSGMLLALSIAIFAFLLIGIGISLAYATIAAHRSILYRQLKADPKFYDSKHRGDSQTPEEFESEMDKLQSNEGHKAFAGGFFVCCFVALTIVFFFFLSRDSHLILKTIFNSSPKDTEISSRQIDYDYEVTYTPFTDERDGHVYKSVKIGSRIWMAENLHYRNTQGTADSSSFYYHKECTNWRKADSVTLCPQTEFGRFYTWAAAMDSAAFISDGGKGCGTGKRCTPADTVQGICPKGWHLPDSTEWADLLIAVGGRSTATQELSRSGWFHDRKSTNDVGFSAFPAGSRTGDGNFIDKDNFANFWTSSETGENRALRIRLDYKSGAAFLNDAPKGEAFPVRCVRDSAASTADSSGVKRREPRSAFVFGGMDNI